MFIQRSRNAELFAGATDGKYRKFPSQSVDPEGRNTQETLKDRLALNMDWHGPQSGTPQSVMVNSATSCPKCGVQ